MTLNADGTHPVAYAPLAVLNERFYVMSRAMPLKFIEEIIKGFEISADHLQ